MTEKSKLTADDIGDGCGCLILFGIVVFGIALAMSIADILGI